MKSQDIRTVDYRSASAARDLTTSILETGFAVLSHHPISWDLVRSVYADWKEFFDSPAKTEFLFNPKTQAGYFPFRSENAKGVAAKDLKEFFHFYPTRSTLPPIVGHRTEELYGALQGLGSEILGWIESQTPPEVRARFPIPLQKMIEASEETLLRILHYPPLQNSSAQASEGGAVRAAAHEDINLITVLTSATAPGLQVLDLNGEWHTVKCDPGTIVINSGDMLREASGGYYPSTTHRVINPVGPDALLPRYSMPLFLHPRRDAPLSRRYTGGSYLDERLREIGLLKDESAWEARSPAPVVPKT